MEKCENKEGNVILKDDFKLVENVAAIMNHFGKFQILSLVILCISFFLCGMTVLSFVFLNIMPQYQCQQSSPNYACNLENQNYYEICNSSKYDHCSRYKINYLPPNMQLFNYSINVTSNFTKEQCVDGWEFDISNGNTVVSQFELICENSWKKPLTVSLFMAGMLFGSLFGGPMADRFGRRWTVLTAITTHSIFHIVLSFSPSYWFYALFVAFLGVVHIVMYITSYTWVQELIHNNEKRVVAAFFINAIFAVGCLATSLLAYYLPNWEWILRALAFLGFAYLPVVWWFIPESPTWYMQRKKMKEAVNVLKTIVKINKIKTNVNKLQQKLCCNDDDDDVKESKSGQVVSPLTLFKNRVFLGRILLICYLWNNSFLGYYTMVLNASNLGGSVYINNVIGGALDIGAAFVMTVMLKKLSRRNTLCIINVVFGLFSVFSPLMKQVNFIAGITFAMCGRFFATASMQVVIFFTGEIFPIMLRNTSMGIASMSSRISSILSPFLVFVGEEIDLSIPFYVMSGASILGAFFVFFLPDTSHAPLSETVEDALKLKRTT